MFFDVLLLIIIIVCAIFGFRNGFLISLSRTFGWLGALIVAFFIRARVGAWLLEHTSFYEQTEARVLRVCGSFVANYTPGPEGANAGNFGETLNRIGDTLAASAAEQITAHLWTVIVFVGIVLGIKLILFVLTLLLSRKFHSGMIGGIDGVAGLLFGLFQSICAILVAFALLLPISYTVSDKAHAFIGKSLHESVVAEFIYENNPLLDFIDGFLPTGLTPTKWLSPDNYENVMHGEGGKPVTP